MIKVVNKRKFVRFLLMCFMLVFVGVLLITNNNVFAEKSRSERVVVRGGDTLWSIAKSYDSNKDVREVIYDIDKLNNLGGRTLRVGEILEVPTYLSSK